MRSILLSSLMFFCLFSSCTAAEESTQNTTLKQSVVVSPAVPEQVVFAGTTVTFDRYDYYERIDRELISFCYMHSTSLLMMKRANRYLPEVEKILAEERIPDDMKYLMLIESNCNPLAISGAGAVGLWQFMPATAKEYGLEVGTTVDERYNVDKSTRAACRYLRAAYEKTGSWFAAAMSYNAGQGAILAQLRRQKVTDAMDLYLNSETSRYVFRILAAKIIMNNPLKYGFCITTDQLYPPFRYSTVSVDSTITDLPQWALNHGITYKQLRDVNPWLRRQELANKSGKKYEIRIISDDSKYQMRNTVECNLPHCK